MTLGRNDAAVSPSFIDGLTLEGAIGHTGKLGNSFVTYAVFSYLLSILLSNL